MSNYDVEFLILLESRRRTRVSCDQSSPVKPSRKYQHQHLVQSVLLRLLKACYLFAIIFPAKKIGIMARGARTAEDDDTWRPTKEDALTEYDDEILEEEMIDEEPRTERQTSARASPGAQRKKPSRRTKHQDDDTWKPTDEDLEDEELEVQEMVNHQLMAEDLDVVPKPKKHTSSKTTKAPKASTPRKKPVGRPKHQDDDVWKPEGEDVESEEPEDEISTYEDSADDEPSIHRRTPPRQAKKRPAASSAGSPELHKTTKPVLASPKHRLTTASNRKAPDFIVKGTNDQAPFTFTAYRGEGMVMLAMNWKNGTPPDDFVGFVIEYTEPQSSKCEYTLSISFFFTER